MKTLSAVVFCVLSLSVCAPLYAESMEAMLWKQVDSCYSQLKDEEAESSDAEIVEDTRNGYLSVSGSYPACGCACSNTAAAYKKANGDYLYFGNESWSCSLSYRVYASEPLESILPEGFGFDSFMDEPAETIPDGLFYIRSMIPRKGTDTTIVISETPFGMVKGCDSALCYDLSGDSWQTSTGMHELRSLLDESADEKLIDKLLDGRFRALLPAEVELIGAALGESSCSREGCPIATKLHEYLKIIHRKYSVYKKLKYKEIVLGWDKKAGRFIVKNRIKIVNHQSFYQFLTSGEFLAVMC